MYIFRIIALTMNILLIFLTLNTNINSKRHPKQNSFLQLRKTQIQNFVPVLLTYHRQYI